MLLHVFVFQQELAKSNAYLSGIIPEE